MMEETNGPRIVISLSAITGISLVLMILRFFCKARYHKKFGWDDHLLSASWISLLTYSSLTIAAVQNGIGRRRALIPTNKLSTALELLYVGRFFGIIALAVSKSSFAVTLLQLAGKGGSQVWQRAVIWFILVSLNLVMWVCGLSLFFQCAPVRKAWDLEVEGLCWDARVQVNIGIGAGAYSALMDFTLALFPTVLIWHLQMGKREKIGVVLAMSLGVFAGITAIIKSYYITGTARSNDFTFSSAYLLIWSGAETAITIMAASVPFLRLMVKEISSSNSRGNKLQKSPPASETATFSTPQQQPEHSRNKFGPEGNRNIRRARESSVDRELKDIMKEDEESSSSSSSRKASLDMVRNDVEDAAAVAGIQKARFMLEGGRMSRFNEMDN